MAQPHFGCPMAARYCHCWEEDLIEDLSECTSCWCEATGVDFGESHPDVMLPEDDAMKCAEMR